MKFVSEYTNPDEDRRAEIFMDSDGTYVVRFFRNTSLTLEQAYPGKHECYVEDAADNWVRGIMKI